MVRKNGKKGQSGKGNPPRRGGRKTGPRNGTGPRGGTPACDKPKNH